MSWLSRNVGIPLTVLALGAAGCGPNKGPANLGKFYTGRLETLKQQLKEEGKNDPTLLNDLNQIQQGEYEWNFPDNPKDTLVLKLDDGQFVRQPYHDHFMYKNFPNDKGVGKGKEE
ncbi:MAG: hypothetical protein QE263_00135 [Vampirovibrionales bacterium]|nr:hypothetical protein [Vampirovibrionales bacterium]